MSLLFTKINTKPKCQNGKISSFCLHCLLACSWTSGLNPPAGLALLSVQTGLSTMTSSWNTLWFTETPAQGNIPKSQKKHREHDCNFDCGLYRVVVFRYETSNSLQLIDSARWQFMRGPVASVTNHVRIACLRMCSFARVRVCPFHSDRFLYLGFTKFS